LWAGTLTRFTPCWGSARARAWRTLATRINAAATAAAVAAVAGFMQVIDCWNPEAFCAIHIMLMYHSL
jgi:hypothetical protein